MRNLLKAMAVSAAIMVVVPSAAHTQEIWVGKDGNIRNVDAKAILIDQEVLYLATRNEVYKAKDIKDGWESVFFLPKGTNEISCLGGRSKNIFVGTKRGLFRSQDLGATWKNVFRTIIPEKNSILSIAVSEHNGKKITIGTRSGIFVSEDSGDRWTDLSGNLKNGATRCLALNKTAIYAGGDSGLYVKRDDAGGWERLLVRSVIEKTADEEPSDSSEAESEEGPAVNCIKIKGDRIYIGVDKKILYSDDEGKKWQDFPSGGLKGTVNYILPSQKDDVMYCATSKGVFEFDRVKSRWLELYKGIDKNISAAQLIFDNENAGSLWAVTDKGLYRLESGKYIVDQYLDVEKDLGRVKAAFDSEPPLQELQRAAIKYAEVSPEKIRNWRREARLRALLPKVSFGIDKNRSTNSEIYTSATKDYVVIGPEDETNNMGVSISWELGDLIWSDDQANIDVRSRLMVQLRNDILDDLRRAYYERKRVQFDLMAEPPKDPRVRFDKEMRLQELTSHIDDLTGNYLSENIKASEDINSPSSKKEDVRN